ncbi:MAG: TROVE domain-containing protein [Saprospiraceae bacterium]
MALFNFKKAPKKVLNKAGGEAYVMTPKLQLASLLLTSFAQDQFYRSAKQTFQELIQLLPQVEPIFAAKAAIFARTQYGMRSITHVLAAELAAQVSGQPWAKDFYDKIIFRPDDMLEILAYFESKGGKHLPNAMKKGFAKAFDRFDSYQLAKYRGENRAYKLVDVVNLVHPKPTERNAEALKSLIVNELRTTQTWETKLTQAGQKAENDAEKAALKAAAWAELLKTNKLGYFALLRNLRNILQQAPELTDVVCQKLVNRHQIKKSLVLPFQYLTALDALQEAASELNINQLRQVQKALNEALELALDNVPKFDGRTLIVLDDSGSMTGARGKQKPPIEIGAIFAAVLYRSNDADLMRFSDDASYLTPYFGDSTMSIADRLIKNARSAGTNFHAIFQKAKQAYDRIIILSDMQGWMGHYSPKATFDQYKQRYGADPFIYSFDLQGYGSLQFPENKVFALAGFSEKVFDIMQLLETDRQALISAIEAIEF